MTSLFLYYVKECYHHIITSNIMSKIGSPILQHFTSKILKKMLNDMAENNYFIGKGEKSTREGSVLLVGVDPMVVGLGELGIFKGVIRRGLVLMAIVKERELLYLTGGGIPPMGCHIELGL